MMTGEPFTDPRLIRPGWVLDVPLPANNVALAGDRVTYRVQSGDSLWCIAQGMLGDGFRWVELWQINEGRVMTDGRTFVNPDLIYPGWVLELPLEAKTEAAIEPVEPVEPAVSPTPEALSPTPLPVAPTLAPAGELVPSPEPSAAPDRPDDGRGGLDLPLPSGKQTLAAAAGLVLAGGAVLAVRAAVRHARGRGLRVVGTDKAGRRPHGDAGKVVLATRSLLSGLAELGFDDLRLLTAREMERYIEFLVECGPGDAEAVVRMRYDLGRRLACRVDGEVEDATHVIMKLSSFQRLAGLLAGGTTDELLLVPVGAGNGVYYLNLAAVGSVLLAGDPHDTGQVASAWTATLSATHRSDELAILVGSNVGGEMAEFEGSAPTEDAGQWPVEQLATELGDALVAREAQANPAAAMPIAALVGISDAWESEALDLETLLRRGPGQGIYVVAVTPNAAEAESLGPFGARVEFGGSLGGQGEAEAMYVDAGDLTLTIGHRPPIVLQPIAVRTELLPQHRPLAEPELDETWAPEAWTPSTEDVAYDEEKQPEAPPAVREDWPDEAALFANPSDTDEEQCLEAGEQASPDTEVEVTGIDEDSTLPLEQEESDPDNSASNAANPVFRVQCFGSFEVTAAGRPASWRIQKSRELFAYLIAHRGTAVPREEVAEALWPEGLPEQVDRLLSNAAYHLRRAFKGSAEADFQVLSIAGQRYHLRADLFRVDADAFIAHLRRAEDLDGAEALVEYERALAIYQGDFLAREPFEWAAPHRQDYQRRFIAAAHRAARLAFDSRDTGRALDFYGAVLTRDPIDEEAARGAMRCYGKLADSNGVRKVYKVLCEALRREFDDDNAEPLPETKALYEELSRTSVR
jgi:DNA-binding SARP family transcriptional activator